MSIEPRLADLPRLLTAVRATGLEVDLRIEGAERILPPSAEAAAYRIVQEALTNVHRHSSASRATVSLRYGEVLHLDISDDGRPKYQSGLAGHGLPGMCERAAIVGGTLRAGPVDAGTGWLVTAVLPIPGQP